MQRYANGAYWNWQQPAAIFDWVDTNIRYVPDPPGGDYAALPSETLRARAGDCEDHAILVASLCEAVGIPARVVATTYNDGGHAFCQVRMGTGCFEDIVADLRRYYSGDSRLRTFSAERDNDGSLWFFADTAGASYFGAEGVSRSDGCMDGPNGVGWHWTVPVQYFRHRDSKARHEGQPGPLVRPSKPLITIEQAVAEGLLQVSTATNGPTARLGDSSPSGWRNRMREPRG